MSRLRGDEGARRLASQLDNEGRVRGYCKKCRALQGRVSHLRRTFRLTPEELDSLIEQQGGVCAICMESPPKHIDHDHDTGEVRGVLCGPCNMGLGQFADDPDRLGAASIYLRVRAPSRHPGAVERLQRMLGLSAAG